MVDLDKSKLSELNTHYMECKVYHLSTFLDSIKIHHTTEETVSVDTGKVP